MLSDLRSHPQVSRLRGDLLNVPGGQFEQGVSQLGQGPGNSQLVADIRHVAINWVEPPLPDAEPADLSSCGRSVATARVRPSCSSITEEVVGGADSAADALR